MKKRLFYFSMLMFSALGLIVGCSGDDHTPEPQKPDPPYEFEYRGHKYKVIQERKTWLDAAEDAAARGGYLVEICNQEEQDAVYGGIQRAGIAANYTEVKDGGGVAYIWIGGTKKEGAWVWGKSGTKFWHGNKNGVGLRGIYVNWGGCSTGNFNEPDNFTHANYSPNGQNSVAMALARWPRDGAPLGVAGEWNDLAGTNLLYYVVEFGDPLHPFPPRESIYVGTGTPDTDAENPAPPTWTGRIVPEPGDAMRFRVYNWANTSDNLFFYCIVKGDKIIIDVQARFYFDGSYNYRCFLPCYFDGTYTVAKTIYEYVIDYNRFTGTLDFSGTIDGYPASLGWAYFDKNDKFLGVDWDKVYSNPKLVLTPVSSP